MIKPISKKILQLGHCGYTNIRRGDSQRYRTFCMYHICPNLVAGMGTGGNLYPFTVVRNENKQSTDIGKSV